MESERNRKTAEEEDEEEDYVEAEIDSTDTLVPNMTDLFGEQLLQKKYIVPNPSGDTHCLIEEEEERPTVPGTVPRRRPLHVGPTGGNRSTRAMASRRRIGAVYGRIAKASVPSPPSPPHVDERTSSMMSHATYVLENDKRKPLVGHCGLKSAVAALRQQPVTARKGKTKESAAEESPQSTVAQKKSNISTAKATHQITIRHHKPVDRRKSEPDENSPRKETTKATTDATAQLIAKATSASVLNELPPEAAPVTGKLATRVPDDANMHEYVAAFGSRPKVTRTPDESSNKPTAMLY